MLGSMPIVESLTKNLTPLGQGPQGVGPGAALSQPGDAVGQSDFGATLAEVMRGSVQTIAKGEAVTLAGIEGKASVQQMVEAVMQAEQTLNAMVAVRDKVVGAYLEISRMQI
jgi:flagellar hook-basal body complex protein FliE